MKITDEDWIKTFGTDTDRIEPPVKVKPGPIPRHQFEAGLIIEKPWLFGFGEQPVQTTETPRPTKSVAMAAVTEHVKARQPTLFDVVDERPETEPDGIGGRSNS